MIASQKGRGLIKGQLRPPKPDPLSQSYTQLPVSKNEISVRRGKGEDILGNVEP